MLLWSMLGAASPWDAHRAESRAWSPSWGPDAAEGVAAFLAKRPAVFPARLGDDDAHLPPWPVPPDDVQPPPGRISPDS